jgi:hypothetical protein
MRLYARPIWLVSGALAVVLLGAVIASDGRWRASDRISVSPRWSIVLELKPMGTPFAEFHRRIRRARSDGPDTLEQALVELSPNAGAQGELCVYRIIAPDGRVVLEFTDVSEQVFVDVESFSRVATAPSGSTRQFMGEFLQVSPLTFVSAARNNRCPYERAA